MKKLLFTTVLFLCNYLSQAQITDVFMEKCTQRPTTEAYSGMLKFDVVEKCTVWQSPNAGGAAVTTLEKGDAVSLKERRFDYWLIMVNGKEGYLYENYLDLPMCFYWLKNLGKK